MPGQPGSENRRRQVVRSTRWHEAEFAQLQRIATESRCSEAELLRRLVKRADKNILITRDLVAEVRRLGVNINQIARRLNAGGEVLPADLLDAYRALLNAVTISRS
jgi:hypothetical protein